MPRALGFPLEFRCDVVADQNEIVGLVRQGRHQAALPEWQSPQRPLRLTKPTQVLRRVHNHDGVHEFRQRKLRLHLHSGELLAGQVLQLRPEQAQALSCARNYPRVTRCPGPGGPSERYRSIRARKPPCPAGSRCHSSASIHHRRTAMVSTLSGRPSAAQRNRIAEVNANAAALRPFSLCGRSHPGAVTRQRAGALRKSVASRISSVVG